ncbi:MAG: sigma-70 family RNA polymerase sigma factor [Oscillospiraceae bacterium]|nr:sigma-70 family RNA polymerase sigma factor [Oscillospiraceae bacterium]
MNLEKIFDEYYERIYRFTLLRVRNVHDAEDITSDVFVKVAQNIHKYDEEKAALSTWLFTITLNLIRDHCRAAKRGTVELEFAENVASSDNIEMSVEDDVMSGERAKALYAALEQLDERQKNILLLRYKSNMSNREIADTLDISESNVETILYRARKKLKKLLKPCEVFSGAPYNL